MDYSLEIVGYCIDFLLLRTVLDNQARQPGREHHFYVSTAKFLFHHPQHGIVREMRDFAKRYEQKWGDGMWLPD